MRSPQSPPTAGVNVTVRPTSAGVKGPKSTVAQSGASTPVMTDSDADSAPPAGAEKLPWTS